jgi:hypothetical protein
MSSGASQPHHLRLVGGFNSPESERALRANQREKARLDIVKENRLAAHGPAAAMDPTDPRWVLAAQTRMRLQGAAISPEHRDQLLSNGRKLGLRAFESNLIIAIVQDQARRTDQPLDVLKHVPPVLSLVSHNPQPVRSPSTWKLWAAAIAAACIAASVLMRWIATR